MEPCFPLLLILPLLLGSCPRDLPQTTVSWTFSCFHVVALQVRTKFTSQLFELSIQNMVKTQVLLYSSACRVPVFLHLLLEILPPIVCSQGFFQNQLPRTVVQFSGGAFDQHLGYPGFDHSTTLPPQGKVKRNKVCYNVVYFGVLSIDICICFSCRYHAVPIVLQHNLKSGSEMPHLCSSC